MPPGVPHPSYLFRTFSEEPGDDGRPWGSGARSSSAASSRCPMREREIVIDRACRPVRLRYEWGVHVAFFSDGFACRHRKRDGEFVSAHASDDRRGPELRLKRGRDRLEKPFPGFVAMLVVDRLEAVDLEGDDDEIVAAGAAILAQLRSPVGEPLAVEEARRWIGGGENRRPLLLLGPSLGFVLEVDVAAPAEQDQRDVERERGACNAHVGAEIAAFDVDVVEERASVPDQQKHGGDQDAQDQCVAPRAEHGGPAYFPC